MKRISQCIFEQLDPGQQTFADCMTQVCCVKSHFLRYETILYYRYKAYCVRSVVLTAVLLKIHTVWNVMPC